MPSSSLQNIPDSVLSQLPSPCYAVDIDAIKRNLKILSHVKTQSNAKILLALKGFAMWSLFPLIRESLDGICASGVIEAQLGHELFQKEVHTYSPGYTEENLMQIMKLSHHVIFNSFYQWEKFAQIRNQFKNQVQFGIRVNPEYAESPVEIYNPCGKNSRLGVRQNNFPHEFIEGLSGLHFHTHCQQNADALERTLQHFNEKFSSIIHPNNIQWINFGGGHHITRPDYDIEKLIYLINETQSKYHTQIYLEPGEAVALNSGVLIATVLDIIDNPIPVAILDLSVSCHMPDVLEMPYRPEIIGAGLPNEKKHSYILAGNSCLAGDQCGQYSFDKPLTPGDRLVFLDMAHYTMVKTTHFNGVQHPAIAWYSSKDNQFQVVREFGYQDYKNRLS